MGTFGPIVQLIGAVMALVGTVWLILAAFEESLWWGLGCLFIPCVSLIFALSNWDRAAKPFLITLAGGLISMLGAMMRGRHLFPMGGLH